MSRYRSCSDSRFRPAARPLAVAAGTRLRSLAWEPSPRSARSSTASSTRRGRSDLGRHGRTRACGGPALLRVGGAFDGRTSRARDRAPRAASAWSASRCSIPAGDRFRPGRRRGRACRAPYALLASRAEKACAQWAGSGRSRWCIRRASRYRLMDAILDMIERQTPDHFAAQIEALLARPDAGARVARDRLPGARALRPAGRVESLSPSTRRSRP